MFINEVLRMDRVAFDKAIKVIREKQLKPSCYGKLGLAKNSSWICIEDEAVSFCQNICHTYYDKGGVTYGIILV